ncbi:isocitrate/isopropylmalate dehydrogenase family protein [Rhodohalobacter sp.]|uniref:isocitrate/isopropylmalate dehydrogenase family protein n=1 Tax=Rhodohalobacter sp. TaxID=1974210 RepID=UPI002ACDA489|nr:isocitrate/isopropylmalate dehydrogenase family protein [Rhodohalobacter sp.]MDZ7758176.1 isocitrate/isopropylmalate dehydrogenase family protein [Rhodohalobacter sp.]
MHNIVLIPGDGIGKEITKSVTKILETAGAKINWIECKAGEGANDELGTPLPQETIDAIKEHRIALKGPLTTPVGAGFRSINVALRQQFNLYSNIRPARSLPNIHSPFQEVDLVLFRENTQGLYIGKEHWVDEEETHAESIAVVTREASEKIITAAFEYAKNRGRKKVTLVHKANILKLTTGLFLEIGKEIAQDYPEIEFEDLIVDNMAMQMVMYPQQFDVIVTTNLFGDILSDLASGLVGGLGVTGAANIGDDAAMFEAVHGSAPDIAGKGLANPTALLFSALMMLEYLGEDRLAEKIRSAIYTVLQEHKEECTLDIGGKGNTESYTEAICKLLRD